MASRRIGWLALQPSQASAAAALLMRRALAGAGPVPSGCGHPSRTLRRSIVCSARGGTHLIRLSPASNQGRPRFAVPAVATALKASQATPAADFFDRTSCEPSPSVRPGCPVRSCDSYSNYLDRLIMPSNRPGIQLLICRCRFGIRLHSSMRPST